MKLGLIAMSGTRAHNPELTAMGLTLPGFVERNKTIASLPSLGLLTLAGMTPGSVEQAYVDVPDAHQVQDLPGPFDAVAISSFSAQMKEAYHLAGRYREAGVKVILGGLHVTALPEEAMRHADAVVTGEAEPVWPQVIRDLQDGKLQPRYDGGGAFDLAHSPMPRFDLLDMTRYNRITIQTQRGCPWKCDFCAASIRLGTKFKTKPVARVIAELHEVKAHWKHPFIELADDNTFADKRHGMELARALAKEGVRWFTETDVSVADDDELLHALRDSGCAQILIGLESPGAGLDGVELAGNWKAKQTDRYLRAVERVQEHGITVNGCFVLGLDGAGAGQFEAVKDFVLKSGLYEVQITVMTAFPGTPLYDRLKAAGRILQDGAWELCTLFDVNFQPDGMGVAELESGFRELARFLYSEEVTEARRRKFFSRLREVKRSERRLPNPAG